MELAAGRSDRADARLFRGDEVARRRADLNNEYGAQAEGTPERKPILSKFNEH